MKSIIVRGNFRNINGDLIHKKCVPGDIVSYRGIRYGIYSRHYTDGGRGYAISELITGLLVCNLDQKKNAKERIRAMHDTCARIVQQMWNESDRNMKYLDLFRDPAQEMTDDEYAALSLGQYGKWGAE